MCPTKLPKTFLTGSARQIAQLVGATAAHPPQSPRRVFEYRLEPSAPKVTPFIGCPESESSMDIRQELRIRTPSPTTW